MSNFKTIQVFLITAFSLCLSNVVFTQTSPVDLSKLISNSELAVEFEMYGENLALEDFRNAIVNDDKFLYDNLSNASRMYESILKHSITYSPANTEKTPVESIANGDFLYRANSNGDSRMDIATSSLFFDGSQSESKTLSSYIKANSYHYNFQKYESGELDLFRHQVSSKIRNYNLMALRPGSYVYFTGLKVHPDIFSDGVVPLHELDHEFDSNGNLVASRGEWTTLIEQDKIRTQGIVISYDITETRDGTKREFIASTYRYLTTYDSDEVIDQHELHWTTTDVLTLDAGFIVPSAGKLERYYGGDILEVQTVTLKEFQVAENILGEYAILPPLQYTVFVNIDGVDTLINPNVEDEVIHPETGKRFVNHLNSRLNVDEMHQEMKRQLKPE